MQVDQSRKTRWETYAVSWGSEGAAVYEAPCSMWQKCGRQKNVSKVLRGQMGVRGDDMSRET